MSGDLGLHPIGMFIKPILEQHDRNQFEIVCFETAVREHWVRDRLRGLSDHWHTVDQLESRAFAELIRDLRIDILVDLSGHTNHNRLETFALHPAPVQVSWMGYLNTTGISTISYRICDRYTDPAPTADTLSTEQLLRLEHSQWCYDSWFAPAEFIRDTRPAGIRFGSPHRLTKLGDGCLDLWCAILREVPTAEVHVLDTPDEARAEILGRFRQRRVDPARVVTYPRFAIERYYAALGNFDISLDSVPYGGGTTTFDSLWMGTPVVAMPGAGPAARNSYNVLSTLGLTELVAYSHKEFIDINVRLAHDLPWREALRTTLRERMLRSPLMDSARFVNGLEDQFRKIWGAWCEGRTIGRS